MRITVSKHAQKRFMERAKLLYPESTKTPGLASAFIHLVIQNTKPIVWDMMSPFYRNKMVFRHKGDFQVFKKGNLFFICKIKGCSIFVVTCVRDFDPRK